MKKKEKSWGERWAAYADFNRKFAEVRRDANDDTPEALEAAAHNAALVRNDWCDCGNPDSNEFANAVYFRSVKKGHGWMCANCKGIIQTG